MTIKEIAKEQLMLKDKITLGGGGKINFQTVGAIAAAVLILLGVVKIFTRPEPPPEVVTPVINNVGVTDLGHESTALKVKDKIKTEGQRRAREAIAEHEKALADDFGGEETANRLMAIGNLQQYQLSDYYSAIQNYRMLVDDDPNHSVAAQAFIEIATCYQKLGDEVQARYVYQEMVETLDPSLQHVKFAKLQLGEE
jgi:hypothetical protein